MTETGIITTVYIAGVIVCGVLFGMASHAGKWNDEYLGEHLFDVFIGCLLWPLLLVLAIVACIVLSPFFLTRLFLYMRGCKNEHN